jgi:hypothetical protein
MLVTQSGICLPVSILFSHGNNKEPDTGDEMDDRLSAALTFDL